MLTKDQLLQRRAEFIRLREQALMQAQAAVGHIAECEFHINLIDEEERKREAEKKPIPIEAAPK